MTEKAAGNSRSWFSRRESAASVRLRPKGYAVIRLSAPSCGLLCDRPRSARLEHGRRQVGNPVTRAEQIHGLLRIQPELG